MFPLITSYQETILHHAIILSAPVKMFALADRYQNHVAKFAKCKRGNRCYNLHSIEDEYCKSETVCYEKQDNIYFFFIFASVFVFLLILPLIKSIK